MTTNEIARLCAIGEQAEKEIARLRAALAAQPSRADLEQALDLARAAGRESDDCGDGPMMSQDGVRMWAEARRLAGLTEPQPETRDPRALPDGIAWDDDFTEPQPEALRCHCWGPDDQACPVHGKNRPTDPQTGAAVDAELFDGKRGINEAHPHVSSPAEARTGQAEDQASPVEELGSDAGEQSVCRAVAAPVGQVASPVPPVTGETTTDEENDQGSCGGSDVPTAAPHEPPPPLRDRPAEPQDRFVCFVWGCASCNRAGNVRVWQRPDETSVEANRRHTRDIRGRCVSGCVYRAFDIHDPSAFVGCGDTEQSGDNASVSLPRDIGDSQDSMIVVALREQVATLQHQQQEAEQTIAQLQEQLRDGLRAQQEAARWRANWLSCTVEKRTEHEGRIAAIRQQDVLTRQFAEIEVIAKAALLRETEARQQLAEAQTTIATLTERIWQLEEAALHHHGEEANATTIATLTRERDEARSGLLDQVRAIVDDDANVFPNFSETRDRLRTKFAALRAQPPGS